MRLPPNRLFYFLPLLLFGCPSPSLSAQTWTTVWTPGNAPAAKTVTSASTREYKTNCYPCKEWEDYGDGTGKWVDSPAGSDPIDCGDGTDCACKECDGTGGLRTKPPGSSASRSTRALANAKATLPDDPSIVIYKCCGDTVYRTDKEGCCAKIVGGKTVYTVTGFPEKSDPCDCDFFQKWCKNGGASAVALTFCYNGKKFSCACGRTSSWSDGVKACMMAHEAKHKADDNLDCPSCEPRYANPINTTQYNDDHCTLYNETLTCLAQLPDDTPGKEDLIKLIKEAKGLGGCHKPI